MSTANAHEHKESKVADQVADKKNKEPTTYLSKGYLKDGYLVGKKLEEGGEYGMALGAGIFLLSFIAWIVGRKMQGKKVFGRGRK